MQLISNLTLILVGMIFDLFQDHSGATSPTRSVTPEKQLSVFENGASKPPPAPPTTKIKVAKLMDAYLAEVARDTNLPLSKFQVLAESLPEFSRPSDDGLYRAIDTYLKVIIWLANFLLCSLSFFNFLSTQQTS